MNQVLIYKDPNAGEYCVWDASTPELKDKAFKSLFKILDQWRAFSFITEDRVTDLQKQIADKERICKDLRNACSPEIVKLQQETTVAVNLLKLTLQDAEFDIKLLAQARNGDHQAALEISRDYARDDWRLEKVEDTND